ncbi:isoprenylcysteine carboxylmethyltransferase family protein [Vibrio sp. S9_S30]|uniref:methyltransferase family protein n=1 Tax=Vibrio sp. S9_S30 TaxID=2720226 RepID=UPI00168135CE|nr:isoprenylcysteine carboxylmethyltransferase family protein [Vibrio sp. S9_S30]MBD1556662.1 isoprenylcysteine carboxylmethyltransferase family protein [Vibrio sp. S9_S30]
MKALELKLPPPFVAAICGLGMWGLPTVPINDSFLLDLLALLLAISGVATAILGLISFRMAHTTFHPTLTEKTTTLVTSGVYRLTRNPMYLGMLQGLIGFGFYLNNGLAFLFCMVFVGYMTRFQIQPEEAFLAERFPQTYPEYKTQVRRWI